MTVIGKASKWMDEHDPLGDITKPVFQKVEKKLRKAKTGRLKSLKVNFKGQDFHVLDPYIWTADVMSELGHPELLIPNPYSGATWGVRGLQGVVKAGPKLVKVAKTVGKPIVKTLQKSSAGKKLGKLAAKGRTSANQTIAKVLTSKRKKAIRSAKDKVMLKAYSAQQKTSDVTKAVEKYRPSSIISSTPLIGRIPGIGRKSALIPKLLPAGSAVRRAETDFLASKMTPDQGFIWDNLMGDVVGARIKGSPPSAPTIDVSNDISSLQAPAGTDESIFQKALEQAVAEVRPNGRSASAGSDVTGLDEKELLAIQLDRIKKLCTKYTSMLEHKAERKHKR